MKKQRPGIQRACAYVVSLKGKKNVTVLPSIRKLAHSAGVSFVTMWKALQLLETGGEITACETGTRRFEFSDAAAEVGKEKTDTEHFEEKYEHHRFNSWQYVTRRLYSDVVSGRFSGDEKLPSCKELQLIYNVSFATLKKALTTLVEERIIDPTTGGYRVPPFTNSTGHAKIVAIGCGWEDGKIWVDYQDKNYFRVLESECIRMNIQLDVIVHFRLKDRLHFVHTASKKEYDLNDRSILGYIFIVANLESNPEKVLERLIRIRRNVAVLDVVGGWKVPRLAKGNRQVQFFTATVSELPARRVAQYLLSTGHRKIGFFSPFHKALWSQRRLTTLEAMFEKAGFTFGVVPFVYDEYAYQWDYLQKQESHDDLRTLVNQYEEWKKEAHGEFLKRFGNLGYSISRYITEWNCASGEIFEKMRPLFDEALRDNSITAWVMANDFTATIAMDYLKDQGAVVPDDVSVVSFDNTLDAMEYQLTSYDFNNHGIITMMLRFILATHTIIPARRSGCIEVDGTLVVRRSTATKQLLTQSTISR